MKRSARKLALALVFAGANAWAQGRTQDPPVAADSAAEARQQYQDGTKAFSGKRYAEAALHFEAAAAFKANAVALYTAGLAWDLAAKPERAADAYARALDVSGLDAKQTNVAKERVAALEKTLGIVSVTAPDGWKVQIDSLSEVVTPARLHAPPGPHVVNVRTSTRTTEKRDVALEAGKVVFLELKDEPKVQPKPPPKDPEPAATKEPPPSPDPLPARLRQKPFWTTFKVVGVGLAGVGLAGVGAGALLGLSANDAKDAYNAAPSRPGFDHADSLQTLTNAAFITGAVLLAAGIVLVVVPIGERDARHGFVPATVKVGAMPGGVALGGTF